MADDWRYGPLGLREEALRAGSPCAAGVVAVRRFQGDRMAQVGPLGMWAEAPYPPPVAAPQEIAVEKYLAALGKAHVPEAVWERVAMAARFFERRFAERSFVQIVDLLRGIDFSRPVRVVKLSQAVPAGRGLVQWRRPHPADLSRDGSRMVSAAPRWLVGNFFAIGGAAPETLGVARGLRRPQRFRVKNGGVDVLVSRTTALVDDFTPGRVPQARLRTLHDLTAYVGEMTGGGGVQIVIPDPVSLYVEPA